MYFREWLINENTTAQELKKYPKEFIKKAKKSVLFGIFTASDFEHQYGKDFANRIINKYVQFLIKLIEKSGHDPLNLRTTPRDWQNPDHDELKKGSPWTLDQWALLMQDYNLPTVTSDYVASAITSTDVKESLKSKLNDPNYDWLALKDDAEKWHESLAKKKLGKGAKGRDLGIRVGSYHWVSLDRKTCEIEAKAGGHCGNAAAHVGDNILSLRDDDDKVYATFVIWEDRILKEAKGRFNKPPEKELHPAIVALLLSGGALDIDLIDYDFSYVDLERGIRDFQVSDLSPELRKKVLSAKPNIDQMGRTRKNKIRGIIIRIQKIKKSSISPEYTAFNDLYNRVSKGIHDNLYPALDIALEWGIEEAAKIKLLTQNFMAKTYFIYHKLSKARYPKDVRDGFRREIEDMIQKWQKELTPWLSEDW